LDRTDRAPELDEGAVAHQLDEAAAMLVDQRLEDVLARGLEGGQRPRLIGTQEAAVANDIGDKNGCKPALHLLSPGLVEILASKFGRPGATDAKIAGPAWWTAAATRRPSGWRLSPSLWGLGVKNCGLQRQIIVI
jgi:hypothetical protein